MFDALCVYCGSSSGAASSPIEAARSVGKTLAERNIRLVYGAGRTGLMGELADAVLRFGGQVTGIIPDHLSAKELVHPDLTELIVVETMHRRKAEMADRADGFLALPGGLGTLEELSEILTWSQLGIHRKPVGLLNTEGFYDPFLAMVDHMIQSGFVKPVHRELFRVSDNIESLIEELAAWTPPPLPRWLTERDR